MLLSDEEIRLAWEALYALDNEGYLYYGTPEYALYEKLGKYLKEAANAA